MMNWIKSHKVELGIVAVILALSFGFYSSKAEASEVPTNQVPTVSVDEAAPSEPEAVVDDEPSLWDKVKRKWLATSVEEEELLAAQEALELRADALEQREAELERQEQAYSERAEGLSLSQSEIAGVLHEFDRCVEAGILKLEGVDGDPIPLTGGEPK